VHPGALDGFCLDVTEVTAGAYARCSECRASGTGSFCNTVGQGKDDHPQNCVDWTAASTYCASVGKRLPTEQEWEYAARGGAEGRLYSWGKSAPSVQNACWNRWHIEAGTCRVGSYPAGAFGLRDMTGNVWEWVEDWYGDYPSSGGKNYAGPSSSGSSYRVLRGGSWCSSGASNPRGSSRSRGTPGGSFGGLGFRCARTR